MNNYLQIHPDDNVIVALEPITQGSRIQVGTKEILVINDIPQGHKIASSTIKKKRTL